MGFLDDYQPVEDRLRQFWDDNPDGRITTELVKAEAGEFIVKAAIWRQSTAVLAGDLAQVKPDLVAVLNTPDGTGYAQEHVEDRGVNAKSALENCETSAIGRALANLGYAPKGARPSREEMSKAAPPVLEDLHCPECGSGVVNNLSAHSANNKQPAFKCSNKNCEGGGAKKKGDGRWPWATWDADFFRHEDPDPNDPEPLREDFEPAPFPPDQETF